MHLLKYGVFVLLVHTPLSVAAETSGTNSYSSIFATENLVAWCIVPFDAKQRPPEERAEMLRSLGIRRLAYDWREEHVPTFDDEIAAMRKYGIEISAFWLWLQSLEPGEDKRAALVLDALRRNRLKTQIWISFNDQILIDLDQHARVDAVSSAILPIARQAKAIGCKVGLYNHGGWFGDPINQIEILKSLDQSNVGLVYNFHHAHKQIDRFEDLLHRMKPHLLAINLNGMQRDGPKILPVGDGESELKMLKLIQESDYEGLIGILDHRENVDAEESLSENLAGLAELRRQLQLTSGNNNNNEKFRELPR